MTIVRRILAALRRLRPRSDDPALTKPEVWEHLRDPR
jgi:hypothetical protein